MNYYELLGISLDASPQEIKHAFRQQIARYHPDKVQHLGEEFQRIAADRAVELTDAYRTLTDPQRRAAHDAWIGTTAARSGETPSDAPAGAAPPSSGTTDADARPGSAGAPPPEAAEARTPGLSSGARFAAERLTRDAFVKEATLRRLREAFDIDGRHFSQFSERGFDLAVQFTKLRLVYRTPVGPLYLFRLVSELTGDAIQEAWTAGSRVASRRGQDTCVLLLGTTDSIQQASKTAAELRRRSLRSRSGGSTKLFVIPVDHRDWTTAAATDMPAPCRDFLEHLKAAS